MTKFVSTRGTQEVDFVDVLLNGLAPDGGLYSPTSLPEIETDKVRTFQDAVACLMEAFAPGFLASDQLRSMMQVAYGEFRADPINPLKTIDNRLTLLDLTQGPTFAFKDFALCLLGPLLDEALKRQGRRGMVLGATSGDTGSAAINGLKNSERVDVVMLHPHGKVTEIQRRQMTTVDSGGVKNLAIRGSFDDCQNLVKAAFTDSSIRERFNLVAVNSINFARVLIQIAYYLDASLTLARDGKIDVCVPTGNFGNVLAAWYAKQLGAPIDKLIVATNSNDAFAQYLLSSRLNAGDVFQTISPSMDIQVPSNLERLLWEVSGKDSEEMAAAFSEFKESGAVTLPQNYAQRVSDEFSSHVVSDAETLETIAVMYKEHGILVDPHTAIGVRAAQLHQGEKPILVCETAAPGKFLDAMEQALGNRFDLPEELAMLLAKPEIFEVVEPNLDAVTMKMQETLR